MNDIQRHHHMLYYKKICRRMSHLSNFTMHPLHPTKQRTEYPANSRATDRRQGILHRFYISRVHLPFVTNFIFFYIFIFSRLLSIVFWIALLSGRGGECCCWLLAAAAAAIQARATSVHILSIFVSCRARTNRRTFYNISSARTPRQCWRCARNRHFPWTHFYDNLFLWARILPHCLCLNASVFHTNGRKQNKKYQKFFWSVSMRLHNARITFKIANAIIAML